MAEPPTPSKYLNMDHMIISPSGLPHNSSGHSNGLAGEGVALQILRTPTKGDTPNIAPKVPLAASPSKLIMVKQVCLMPTLVNVPV